MLLQKGGKTESPSRGKRPLKSSAKEERGCEVSFLVKGRERDHLAHVKVRKKKGTQTEDLLSASSL